MHKYQGEVIHQSHDPLGPIEVVEDGTYRSLHFGTDAKQSSMLLRDPVQLTLSYTRAMCATLLFCSPPRRILLLGLGGGSLAKFFLCHYPGSHIDAVEFRPQVHRVAQRFFALPDDPRLQLHYQDAGEFVRGAAKGHGDYDLILIDTFLDYGIAYSVCQRDFFNDCRGRLKRDGVLGINLWADDRLHAGDFLEDISESFNKQLLSLPVEGKANIIAIASRLGEIKKRLHRVDERARELEQQTGLEFPRLLNALRKANRRLF